MPMCECMRENWRERRVLASIGSRVSILDDKTITPTCWILFTSVLNQPKRQITRMHFCPCVPANAQCTRAYAYAMDEWGLFIYRIMGCAESIICQRLAYYLNNLRQKCINIDFFFHHPTYFMANHRIHSNVLYCFAKQRLNQKWIVGCFDEIAKKQRHCLLLYNYKFISARKSSLERTQHGFASAFTKIADHSFFVFVPLILTEMHAAMQNSECTQCWMSDNRRVMWADIILDWCL